MGEEQGNDAWELGGLGDTPPTYVGGLGVCEVSGELGGLGDVPPTYVLTSEASGGVMRFGSSVVNHCLHRLL